MGQGGEPGVWDARLEAIVIVTLWCLAVGLQASPGTWPRLGIHTSSRAVTFRDIVEDLHPGTHWDPAESYCMHCLGLTACKPCLCLLVLFWDLLTGSGAYVCQGCHSVYVLPQAQLGSQWCLMNKDSFPSSFIHKLIHPINTMTLDHFQEQCQTLVFLEKNQTRFLSWGRDRLVTSSVISVIIKARIKASFGGVYRNISQRSRTLNQALKCEQKFCRWWKKNKVFVGGYSLMQDPKGIKETVTSW